jgi:hypothetical protein
MGGLEAGLFPTKEALFRAVVAKVVRLVLLT